MVPDPQGLLAQNGLPLSALRLPPPNSSHYPSYSFADWLFTARPGLFGTIHGVANPTGKGHVLWAAANLAELAWHVG